MFDFANDRQFDGETETIVDADTLSRRLEGLSNDELDALEDELDFCRFAGVTSPRILTILNQLTELDAQWQAQLDRTMEAKAA